MNGRAWTDEELRTLGRMVDEGRTKADIARALRRRYSSITVKMTAMRTSLYHGNRRYSRQAWSRKDIEYLTRYYGHKPTRVIARKLDRSVEAIYACARRIGIVRELRDDIERMMTAHDVADYIGVSSNTVQTWWSQHGLPYEKLGKSYITYEEAVLKWLRDGHILRCTRDALPGHLQRMYDTVRSEHYTKDDMTAMDVPIMNPEYWPQISNRDGIDAPRTFLVGRGGSGRGSAARITRTPYYRKDEVRAWAWRYGHLIPETVKYPDLTDIVTAWLSHYITCAELYQVVPQTTCSEWQRTRDFPKQVKPRAYYDRAEVVAWLRGRGMHAEARRIYRGAPLCYDESIRERERRHA